MTFRNLFIISVLGAAAASCGDSGADVAVFDAAVEVQYPAELAGVPVDGAAVTFTNISSGVESRFPVDASGIVTPRLIPGVYDLELSGTAVLESGVSCGVRGVARNVSITGPGDPIVLTAFVTVETDDLIISELYFTGSLQPSGDQYYGDQYFKLYNNTSHVVYADGLSIVESQFLTTQKFVYTPDIMAGAMSVDAVYTIPGSGTDYPVQPGGELLIADIAIDHRAVNPNSIDLSHADFEWYDESSDPKYTDIDNPAVPNLDKWYCYTRTVWLLHNRGFKAYALARIPVGRDEYLAGYRYTADYVQVTAAGSFPMSRTCYRLPNEWITDVVTCSVPSDFKWNVTAPGLDSGWTGCGEIDGDRNRYFRAVRRAVAAEDAGRLILRKTNNSGHDFNGGVRPSEVERQRAAVDRSGTPCATLTLDGVKPLPQ